VDHPSSIHRNREIQAGQLMVNLLAMVFLMVNGAPTEKPVQTFAYNQTFESLEACMAFSKTEEGLVISHALDQYVMAQRGKIMVRIGCAQAEDNTI
jgi:hypothetical protein